MKKKDKIYSVDTIFAGIFLIVFILAIYGIVSVGLSPEASGAGDAYAFLLIYTSFPTIYYLIIFLVCLFHDAKLIAMNEKARRCLVFIPAGIIIVIVLCYSIFPKLSWILAENSNQKYKNISITIPEDFELRLYTNQGMKRDASFVPMDDELYCWINFIGYKNDGNFLGGFETQFNNNFTISSKDLLDVDIQGRKWSYYERKGNYPTVVYGYDDGKYFYYLVESTNKENADFCNQKMDEVIKSVKYNK